MGQFNESDYFTYVAGFGLFTGTSYQTPQELKNQLGHFAYILQGLAELGQMHAYRIHVEALPETAENTAQVEKEQAVPAVSDQRIVLDGEYALGLITNSRSIGGFQNLTGPEVDLQDGLFEVTLVRMPKNPLEVSEILMGIANPETQTSMIDSFKTSCIELTSDERIAWTRDGEFAGSHKHVRLRICPGQLRILVPEWFAAKG